MLMAKNQWLATRVLRWRASWHKPSLGAIISVIKSGGNERHVSISVSKQRHHIVA